MKPLMQIHIQEICFTATILQLFILFYLIYMLMQSFQAFWRYVQEKQKN